MDGQHAELSRLWTRPMSAPITRMAVDRSGQWLAVPSRDGWLRILSTDDGRQVAATMVKGDRPNATGAGAACWRPDGQSLFFGGADSPLVEWAWSKDKLSRTSLRGLKAITHMAWAPSGRRLAVTSQKGRVAVLDMPGGQAVVLREGQEVTAACWTNETTLILSVDNELVQRNVTRAKSGRVKYPNVHSNRTFMVTKNPVRPEVYSCGADGQVVRWLWRRDRGQLVVGSKW